MTRPNSLNEGFRLLRERNFALLFSARLVSMFGTAMAPLAIAFGVLELTGSAAQMGIVIASQTAAQIGITLFGGATADRSSRQRQMVLADLLATFSQATMAILFLTGLADVINLSVLMAFNGIASGFHQPAETGLLPQVVPIHKLQAGNALMGAARSGALAMGAATAGVLVALFGAGWALVIDSLTFAVSGYLVWQLKPAEQLRGQAASLLTDMREGWREFIAHRWLWVIVLQFSLVVAAQESVFALIGPTVAKRLLGGAIDWGLIAGAMGVGTLAGGFVAMRLNVQRPMLVATLLVFPFAIPALLLSIPASLPVIAAGAFINGVCGQIFGVLWYTTLQQKIPAQALSRVSAYDHVGSIGLAPLGLVAAGWFLEAFGIRLTLYIAIAMVILPTLAALAVKDVRTLRV
jgi:predicted MFS family arabinose efflux permease